MNTLQIYSNPEFADIFHPNFHVTASHRTNGMRTRMAALRHALNLEVITDIKDAKGTLLVEPFVVKPRELERLAIDNEKYDLKKYKVDYHRQWKKKWVALEDKYVDEICVYSGEKHLICSEMEVLRWRGALRKKITDAMSSVFTTCDYQSQLLRAVGVQSECLPEPINEFLFYPTAKRPNQIVAIGAANHVKNTRMLIDFYRALEGSGYHRVYIGGPKSVGVFDR